MSRYPEADEAQHRHYNDGYLSYPPQATTPNPYEQQQHYDNPFATPNTYVGGFTSPPPPPPPPPPPLGPTHDAYGVPIRHPLSPPPQPTHDYLATPFQPPAPSISPASSNTVYSGAQHQYGDAHEDLADTGDMPLLRRDPSYGAGIQMPGAYGDDGMTPEERMESNIRYGRIPQRVPRRYKTIKKVE